MKNFIVFLMALVIFLSLKVEAQLKPAQSQYLVEKGVLINPSFEQGYKGWVITGCTKSLVTETPYLDKSLKLTCTNETFSIKQVSASLIDFKNQQGAFDLQIKTTASGVNVSSITNGARDNAYSILDSTTFKRFKEIGFIVGDTDNGIEVYSDTNFTGEIIVDNFKLGLGNLTQDIGAAHFVGKLAFSDPSCAQSNTSTSYALFGTNVNCIPTNSDLGSLSKPDTDRVGVKIPNARTDGTYTVKFYGLYSRTNAGGFCEFSMGLEGIKDNEQQVQYRDNDAAYGQVISYSKKFSTGGSKNIYPISKVGPPTTSCTLYGSSTYISTMEVTFFPDSKNTIVSQDTELTAKTANELTLRGDSSGVILSENYDFINGDCTRASAGVYNCLYVSDLALIHIMSCVPTAANDNNRYSVIGNEALSGFTVYTTASTGTAVDGNFNITCSKQLTDVNKSQTIVGTFEQIERIDGTLTKETANIINIKSTNNSVSSTSFGLTSDYVVANPSTGVVSINYASLGLTVPPSITVTADHHGGVDASASISYASVISTTGVSMYVGNSSGVLFNPTLVSWSIAKQGADVNKDIKGAIISVSDQATKCQTKFLSANVSTSGILSDLTWSDLILGRVYSFSSNFRMVDSNGSNVEKYVAISIKNSNDSVSNTLGSGYARATTTAFQTTISIGRKFTAINVNFATNFVNVSNMQVAGGSVDYGWVQLCLEPETTLLQ